MLVTKFVTDVLNYTHKLQVLNYKRKNRLGT
jgi:hypothetical protein